MNNNIIPQNKQKKPYVFSDALKTSSLRRLKEALAKEEYESCAGLVHLARKRGVSEAQIKFLLAWHVVGGKENAGKDFRKVRRF